MSLLKSPYKVESVFKTYLVNQDDSEEAEKPDENPTNPQTAWMHRGYTPKRASWHTVSGKIKRYFS